MVIVLKKWQRKSDPSEGVRKRREADSPSFITVISNSRHRKLPTCDLMELRNHFPHRENWDALKSPTHKILNIGVC